ncbi:hypothetical protein OROMI_024757 [Orobanche minor]
MRESSGYADKRGVPRDASEEHTKPYDELFQQSNSKYFGSESLPGEMSHRKVHLGAGSKRHQEDWCKVSPEIKGGMSDWVKDLTASRMKKSKAAGEQPDRRGRPLDDAWGHAKPLDEARQKTRCNHCGFVSSYGWISRLKAHLGGGSPQMQLQGCPQVPLEAKRVME